jgi:hypothetical protein
MISILIRIIAEGAKAAAPHVARHAHHVVRPATGHVAPLLIPKLATGGASAGAVGGAVRAGQVKAKGVHTAASHVPAKPHVSPSTGARVAHFAEGTAEEIVAAEGLTRGGKAVVRKVREARHEGPDEAARPSAA